MCCIFLGFCHKHNHLGRYSLHLLLLSGRFIPCTALLLKCAPKCNLELGKVNQVLKLLLSFIQSYTIYIKHKLRTFLPFVRLIKYATSILYTTLAYLFIPRLLPEGLKPFSPVPIKSSANELVRIDNLKRSLGLVVMVGDSCYKGCEFES